MHTRNTCFNKGHKHRNIHPKEKLIDKRKGVEEGVFMAERCWFFNEQLLSFFFFKFLRSKWWKVKKQREVEAKSKSRGKRSNSVWMLEAEIYKESHSFFSTSIQETFMYQLYVSPFYKKLHYTRWFKKYSIHYSVYYSTW